MKYLLFLIFCFPLSVIAQSALEQPLDFSITESSIPDCLRQLSRQSGLEIAFSSQYFDADSRRSYHFRQTSLTKILDAILSGTELKYRYSHGRILLTRTSPQLFTLSGYVEDQESGERLVMAAVYAPGLDRGTVTNEYGFFSLRLPAGEYELRTQYLGYQEQAQLIQLNEDRWQHFRLQQHNFLREVVVTPDSIVNPHFISNEEQEYQLSPQLTAMLPSLGGEPDPLRTAQLLPGVASVTDGQSGLQVRGGNNGQNLILLDGVPVYIPYHLLGFHSAYNSSTIKSAQLLTGNFSARYGGALSSVLDVRTREGNRYRWSGEGEANLNTLKVLLEGPLVKEKSSLLLAARISHSNFLYQPVLNELAFFEIDNPLSSNYFDLNAKWNYQFSRQDRLYLSVYHGGDALEATESEFFEEDGESSLEEYSLALDWSNTIVSLRWNHLFSDELFANLNLTYSRHRFSNSSLLELFEDDDEIQEEYFFSTIQSNNLDYGFRLDFDYSPGQAHHVRWGLGAFDRRFSPDIASFDQDSLFDNDEILENIEDFEGLVTTLELEASELYAYLEDQWQISPDLRLRLGLRASTFGETLLDNFQLEPRIALDYSISPQLNWKLAGSRMVQQLHLISSSSLQLPSDLWLPSLGDIEPQTVWLLETGLRFSPNEQLRLSLNAYSKNMRSLYRLPDYTSTTELGLAELEDILFQGNGFTKGLELLVEYHQPKFGWMATYSLADAQREFPDLNNASLERFPAAYDSRHQFKCFVYQQINDRLRWSLNWIYSSPSPQRYLQVSDLDGSLVNVPAQAGEDRNSRRSTAYHRLDLGLDYQFKSAKIQHQFHLGAYNLYARENIAFYQAESFDEPGPAEPVATLSIIPALRYRLQF